MRGVSSPCVLLPAAPVGRASYRQGPPVKRHAGRARRSVGRQAGRARRSVGRHTGRAVRVSHMQGSAGGKVAGRPTAGGGQRSSPDRRRKEFLSGAAAWSSDLPGRSGHSAPASCPEELPSARHFLRARCQPRRRRVARRATHAPPATHLDQSSWPAESLAWATDRIARRRDTSDESTGNRRNPAAAGRGTGAGRQGGGGGSCELCP